MGDRRLKAFPSAEDGEREPAASVPPGTVVYAVGDIHGCSRLLDDLLAKITADAEGVGAAQRVLVFIGDYVDRGPDSAGVIERMVSGLPDGFAPVFLKGNHEALMLDFLAQPETLYGWLLNGAGPTLLSYGLEAASPDLQWQDAAVCRAALLRAMPDTHYSFLESLQLSFTLGDYFFAHAGVDPETPLKRQKPEDLMWIRGAFLASTQDFGKIVVHGHTPVSAPEVRRNRIGIDTGAVLSGRLTALRLFGTSRSFLVAGD